MPGCSALMVRILSLERFNIVKPGLLNGIRSFPEQKNVFSL
jgi:hypothetical protein